MINSDFLISLEYHLTEFFRNSNDKIYQSFWCDGVCISEGQMGNEGNLNFYKKEIILIAFAGKDGQDKYSLVLRLGNKSLSRITRALEIKNCIPDIKQEEFYRIDTNSKTITIQLL